MGLNPRCKPIEIGVRTLRTITIFPMSMADEFKFTSTLTAAFQEFSAIEKEESEKLENILPEDTLSPRAVVFIIQSIEKNLMEILKMVCEEPVTMEDITNEQFAELCEVIYDMSFAGAVGKFQSLWNKIKSIFPQTKPSPNSFSQPVIGPSISTDTVSSKED